MSGPGSNIFGTGFRAYHPQHGAGVPDFLMSWKLRWKRGLGGAQDTSMPVWKVLASRRWQAPAH